MTTRSVRIPDEIDVKLSALAESEHSSVNSTIVRAVEEYIAHRRQESAIAEAADKVFGRRAGLFQRLADA